jgi:hypothetical protein
MSLAEYICEYCGKVDFASEDDFLDHLNYRDDGYLDNAPECMDNVESYFESIGEVN